IARFDGVQSGRGRCDGLRLITFALDEEAERLEDIGLIVGDQDGGSVRIGCFHLVSLDVRTFRGAGPLARGRSPDRPARMQEEPDQGVRRGRGRPPHVLCGAGWQPATELYSACWPRRRCACSLLFLPWPTSFYS